MWRSALPYRTVTRQVKAFREGRDAVQENIGKGILHVENNTVKLRFPLYNMSENCAAHSARHSDLPQTCSALNTPWNFRGVTMPPLCSRTGLVGPVPKGRWFSWRNRRYGRNLGSLIRTKLEMPIKWMEASRFSSFKDCAPYTMCCQGDVHCGVCHWWDISKADGIRSILLHFPAAPPSPSAQEKTTLDGTEHNHSSWQCKVSHRCCCHGPLLSRRW